jgi:simple sugar transport system ATP-binding protein
MVGEDFVTRLPDRSRETKTPMLRAEGITVIDNKGRTLVNGVSLTANTGEVMGIAGVAGNGQKQLAEALVGLSRVRSGTITFAGSIVTNQPHRKLRRSGLGYVPEEGSLVGNVPDFTVAENLSLTSYDTGGSSILLKVREIKERARELISEFEITPPDANRLTRQLSGGNAHKVIVARELSRPLKVLVIYNPTKGLDVRTTTLVRRKILERRNLGTAIVLISEDLEEIMEVSDEVAVMFEGRLSEAVETQRIGVQEIGRMMSGHALTGATS